MDTSGNFVELKPGVKVKNSAGEEVEFKGDPVTMKQLVVTYEFLDGIKYSDGAPLIKADFELAYRIGCDRDSGAVTYINCDRTEKVDFLSDTSYRVTLKPGVQEAMYFLPSIGWYHSTRVIESEGPYKGKTLAEVSAKDWATLPETTENLIDIGPYVLKEWVKGEKLVFEANPYYVKGPAKIKNLILSIVTPENAEAQLLAGQVDVLGLDTLNSVSQTLKDAADEGKIKLAVIPAGSWEHIDMNLFVK